MTRAERIRLRRAQWTGGRVPLHDPEQADIEFWQALDPAVRLLAVWELSLESYGEDTAQASGRLRRSADRLERTQYRAGNASSFGLWGAAIGA